MLPVEMVTVGATNIPNILKLHMSSGQFHLYRMREVRYYFFISSRCYKTLYGGNLDFHKVKKLKKFVLMIEHAQKCENNAI